MPEGGLKKQKEAFELLENSFSNHDRNKTLNEHETSDKSLNNQRKSKPHVLSCPNEGCTAVFNRRTSLDSHLQSECGVTPKYKCGFCNYKCSFPLKLRYHIFKVHGTNEFTMINVPQEENSKKTKKTTD